MTKPELESLLQAIPDCRVAVIGDFCLNIYWFIDLAASKLSLETGQPTHPVRQQRYTLGATGNVANNLAAAGCRHVHVLGVVSEDPWGRTLRAMLTAIGADPRVNGMAVTVKQYTATETPKAPAIIEDFRYEITAAAGGKSASRIVSVKELGQPVILTLK